MNLRLIQQQSQKLILSPQMRQFLRLLQLPLAQLLQTVETELSENPVLEEVTEQNERLGEVSPGSETEAPSPTKSDAQELRLGESFENLNKMEEALGDGVSDSRPSLSDPKDLQKNKDYQASLITRPEALSDFLLSQMRLLDLNDEGGKIAQEIIGNIDENGYLKASIEEMAQSLAVPVERIDKILAAIQEFDPPGVGARNLQEALLIQLRRKGPEAGLARTLVEQHLELLRKRDWAGLAKILQVDLGEIREAAQIISKLDPKPGRTFYVEEPTAVTPDALVEFDEEQDGKLKVTVNEGELPPLRISSYYRRLLRDPSLDEQAKNFIRIKIQSAMDFLTALRQRKSTLQEITETIVRIQREFFEKGFSHLRPLRLKDVASEIGVHESTISRAIQGKYISTPQGTIPYRSFFSAKLDTLTGEEESQKSAMERIRRLIQNEKPEAPYSDEDILKILKGEGVVIARRTVAKYRDLLKILPSHMRRRK